MWHSIKLALFCVMLLVSGDVGKAAELKEIENPVAQSTGELLDLNKEYSEAVGFIRGLEKSEPERRAKNKQALKENWGWIFKDGLGTDGAHTFETLHIPAAWFGLKIGRVIEISGTIERGDTDKLKQLAEDTGFSDCLKPGYCPFNNVISLNSPGGNFAEALKLAEYISQKNFITVLKPGAACESACSMVFLSGYTKYEGFFFPRRFAHETARLGVHQPSIQLPPGTYSADQVDKVVGVINETINRVTKYFLEAGADIGLMRNMYATPPDRMYHLPPAEMAQQGIFIFGAKKAVAAMTRSSILAYCSSLYKARYNEVHDDLLRNLFSDERTFVTFVTGRNFVCLGVKDKEAENWKVSTCIGKTCDLAKYGQADMFKRNVKSETLMDIATFIDNAEVGIALKKFKHRTALLRYLRLFASDKPLAMKSLPAAAARAEVPKKFCGQVDENNAHLVRKLQAGLNATDINVGKPDGSLGPGTRKAFGVANAKLLKRKDSRVTPALILALGLDQATADKYTLCK